MENISNTSCLVHVVQDFTFGFVASAQQDELTSPFLDVFTPIGFLILSLCLAFFGYYAMRLSIGICAFVAGFSGLLHMATFFSIIENVNCDGILIASLVVGSICALISVYLMRSVSFLFGCASASGIVVMAFSTCGDACNRALWPDAPMLFERQIVPFWSVLLVTTTLAGCVARKKYKELLAVAAATLGGYGTKVCVQRLLLDAGHHEMSPVASVVLIFSVSAGGLGFQYFMYRRFVKRKVKKEKEDREPKKWCCV